MIEILTRLMNEKKYVSVYTYGGDQEKFIFGKIIGINEEYIALSMVSPDGEYDGVLVKRIEDVLRVETLTKYEKKMRYLMNIRGLIESEIRAPTSDIMRWGFAEAMEKRQIVSVELNKSGIGDTIGFVNSLSNDTCEIKQIDEYGEEDGVCYFMVTDVSQLCFGSCDEKRLELLINGNG